MTIPCLLSLSSPSLLRVRTILLTDVSLDVVRSFSPVLGLQLASTLSRDSLFPPSLTLLHHTHLPTTRSEIVDNPSDYHSFSTTIQQRNLFLTGHREIYIEKAQDQPTTCAAHSTPWCWPPLPLARPTLPLSPTSTRTCTTMPNVGMIMSSKHLKCNTEDLNVD